MGIIENNSISWLMPLSPRESPTFLAKTLFCLKQQTIKAIELVIAVDGQLTKELKRVIEDSDLAIQLYSQEKSKGIGATLKDIAPLCKGSIIIRIDSDDLYAPEHTSTLVEAIRLRPELGVIGCQLIEIEADNMSKLTARKTPLNPRKIKQWLPWRNPLNHQTVAIRKDALILSGGYRDMPGFEDWDLWIRIAQTGFELANLSSFTAAARVDTQHRLRRKGISYLAKESIFYWYQIKENKIGLLTGLIAYLSRIPFRILPLQILTWWMKSKYRGSPSIESAWIAKLIP